MSNSLKKRTVNGILWSSIERFSQQGIQLIISIILARLLLPEQFGLIGMLVIFIAISQAFLVSGFGQALIQKKNPTQTDFSTVFYFNIVAGVILYSILYITAPYIAKFYNEPQLILLTRFIALSIIINSFGLIQNTILTKKIDFKTLTKVSIISTVLSGAISIYMAVKGFGVWSLAFQSVGGTFFRTLSIWLFSRWRPTLEFSIKSFKTLFSFGSKLLASSLLDVTFRNIYLLVIGKAFTATDLGFYARAKRAQELPVRNINSIVQRVTFPAFSTIQDEDVRLKKGYKKAIQTLVFINFPLMLGLIVIAKPLIIVLITEKWLPAIPYFQLLCITGLLYPIQSLNLNIIKVKGRSDLFLKLEIIKKIIVIAAIAITLRFGILALIIGQIITSFIAYYLNSYYSGHFINYGLKQQIIDILPYFGIASLMAGITWSVGLIFNTPYFVRLIVQVIIGIASYILFSKLFKAEICTEVYNTFKSIFLRKTMLKTI